MEDVYGDFIGYASSHSRSVVYGNSITFGVSVRDENDDLVDPDELYFQLFRSQMRATGRRYSLDDDELVRVSEGLYEVTVDIPEWLVPAQYTVQWEIVDGDGGQSYEREQFHVIDPPVTDLTTFDPPRTAGQIIEALNYTDVGRGQTDVIALIGHADGLTLNDPYHVGDIQEAINLLQADLASPLLRAMLDAFNAGCRDIMLVAAAPMREYVADLDSRADERDEWGGDNYYERYAKRLETTYAELNDYDMFDVIVPLEAPFYDALGTDFFIPFIQFCTDIFLATGNPPVGVIGTRYDLFTDEDIDNIVADERFTTIQNDPILTAGGKLVLIAFGEGLIQTPFLPNVIGGSVNVAVGAFLASSSLDRGLTYTKLPGVARIRGAQFTKEQATKLANARINPLVYTSVGKRGAGFNTVLATDITQAPPGSDYWSVVQMRLVARIIRDMRVLGNFAVGTTHYTMLQEKIKTYFRGLQQRDYLKDYTFDLQRDPLDPGRLTLDIVLWPRLGLNDIRFKVFVGPERPLSTIPQYTLSEDYVYSPELAASLGE
jgi:hypothetical protein